MSKQMKTFSNKIFEFRKKNCYIILIKFKFVWNRQCRYSLRDFLGKIFFDASNLKIMKFQCLSEEMMELGRQLHKDCQEQSGADEGELSHN